MSCRVAIVGGGPGGLMTAYQLQKRCKVPYEVTIYEAGKRLGGKVLTRSFAAAPVIYEAGAAELYDYSQVGEDPLRELVESFGFKVKAMAGPDVILDENVFKGFADVGREYGASARQSLVEFHQRAERWMSATEFYDSDWKAANEDPKSRTTFEDELMLVPDADARRYLRTMVHSDLATEPHRTTAAYGLQNYLMNAAGYLQLYTIEGGIAQLMTALAEESTADVRLQQRVTRVEHGAEQTLRVYSRRIGDGPIGQDSIGEGLIGQEWEDCVEEYDFVVAALPNNYLPAIEWGDEASAEAMKRHHIHYDYPAHYLRVSVLFRNVFWREHLHGSYVMLDAFGGCCLYDEGSRNECGDYGVLGWLLAGEAAVTAANYSDEDLIAMVLDALPSYLQHGRELVLEGHVHRWLGAVNGLPGGRPAQDPEARHVPEPARPNLLVVGDYLFDSTLNGVLDSADYVAEMLAEAMELRNAIRSMQGVA
jgi:protoporphyrinogen oxidase